MRPLPKSARLCNFTLPAEERCSCWHPQKTDSNEGPCKSSCRLQGQNKRQVIQKHWVIRKKTHKKHFLLQFLCRAAQSHPFRKLLGFFHVKFASRKVVAFYYPPGWIRFCIITCVCTSSSFTSAKKKKQVSEKKREEKRGGRYIFVRGNYFCKHAIIPPFHLHMMNAGQSGRVADRMYGLSFRYHAAPCFKLAKCKWCKYWLPRCTTGGFFRLLKVMKSGSLWIPYSSLTIPSSTHSSLPPPPPPPIPPPQCPHEMYAHLLWKSITSL